MAVFARPLEGDDLGALLAIDRAYAAAHGVDPVVTRGSVAYFQRSGHAFVALRRGDLLGFVLAHAVWNGQRPVVMADRLAVRDAGPDRAGPERSEVRLALIEALTKSAYDAAVYDIVVVAPEADHAAQAALLGRSYRRTPLVLLSRTLGSRGQSRDEPDVRPD